MSQTNDKIVASLAPWDQRLNEAIEFCNARRFSAALSRLIKLIDEGCNEAYYHVGHIYEEGGDGVDKDLPKAIFYYEKSAQEHGSVEGALALARLYYFGLGVATDYKKAFELLNLIANETNNGRGHGVAHMLLGQMYTFGQGVEQNFSTAHDYFEKAASQGYVFAFSALSTLEWKLGNYFKSLGLRIKAVWLSTWVAWRNPNDYRLRRS